MHASPPTRSLLIPSLCSWLLPRFVLECEFVASGNAFQLGSLGCPSREHYYTAELFLYQSPVGVAKKSGTAPSAGSKKMAKKIRYRYRPTR